MWIIALSCFLTYFYFAWIFILLETVLWGLKQIKNMLGVAVPYPEFSGYTGTGTRTRTSTKVLEGAPSDRQTDRQ